ncbi:DMT family transporter [Dehalobacterium formicoaceticum]
MLGTTLGKINTLGVLFAAGASVVYAGYVILSNKILKQVPPIIATAFICLFISLGLFVAGLSSKSLNFGFQGTAWPWIIGLVIVSTICAMLTFFQGLEILGPTKATVLSTAEPVFGVIIAMILFSDRLTKIQFFGAFGVIVDAIIAVYARDNIKEQQNRLTEGRDC